MHLRELGAVGVNFQICVQGTMLDMMRDVNTGIRWVLHHTHFHGGDPNQVYLVGQSCGAQLAAMAMITQVGPCCCPFSSIAHWSTTGPGKECLSSGCTLMLLPWHAQGMLYAVHSLPL